MQLIATSSQILPLQTGTGKNGTWKKQDIIVETEGQYPKKICVALWGDKADINYSVGQKLKIDFDVESREFNGKWYTDVKAWKIEVTEGSPIGSASESTSSIPRKTPEELSSSDVGGLPF